MTAKEKADELITKFMNANSYKKDDGEMIIHKEPYTSSKRCALISVYEILKTPLNYGDYHKESLYPECYYDFWQEVKQEIEKL